MEAMEALKKALPALIKSIPTVLNVLKKKQDNLEYKPWEGKSYGYYRSPKHPNIINRMDIEITRSTSGQPEVTIEYASNDKKGDGKGTLKILGGETYFEIECTDGNHHHMDYMVMKNIRMKDEWWGTFCSIGLDVPEPCCGVQIITRTCYDASSPHILEKMVAYEEIVGISYKSEQ